RASRRPPHIVLTTPESLYILLGSESGRKMLATTRTVIVDEIHALAPNKRGTHLALSLEVPDSPLEAVMSAEVWEQVYGRLAALINEHRTTLIFVNTRRMAERVTR